MDGCIWVSELFGFKSVPCDGKVSEVADNGTERLENTNRLEESKELDEIKELGTLLTFPADEDMLRLFAELVNMVLSEVDFEKLAEALLVYKVEASEVEIVVSSSADEVARETTRVVELLSGSDNDVVVSELVSPKEDEVAD